MADKIEYSNKDITIVWQPKVCQHSAVCVKTLPNVYKPDEKPWISIENATTEELKNQINKCPSGALTFYENK
jgi:uncharacterized Fe-S cluster protein YjdI